MGDKLRREIEFSDIQLRQGSTGNLIVTTQTRRIFTPRGLALTEAANTVFREEVKAGDKAGVPVRDAAPSDVPWRRTITPSSVMLFRYSAITFNPHRIHYDKPYCMEVEGYPGLVVHGPFAQQCLFDLLRDSTPGRRIKTFTVRARAPLFDNAPFNVVGRPTADGKGRRAVDRDAQGHYRGAGDGDAAVAARCAQTKAAANAAIASSASSRPITGGSGSVRSRVAKPTVAIMLSSRTAATRLRVTANSAETPIHTTVTVAALASVFQGAG